MGQDNILIDNMILKYGSVISAALFGSIIIGYLIYLLFTSGGSSGSKKNNRKFLGYSSLDKLYDEAGGNDPLSNARLTSDINLSSDTQSCKFQVIYEGNNKREVKCISGCDEDEDDEHSDFCKQFEYPDGDDNLKDTFLDETYIRRRGNRDSE
tara:strand:+ start:165 stop:623 length:459 start_codon:yes stop_codon:yes gene_type:complete